NGERVDWAKITPLYFFTALYIFMHKTNSFYSSKNIFKKVLQITFNHGMMVSVKKHAYFLTLLNRKEEQR
ncbi:UNVERIFIED_CONTAM: hypothetical protein RF648_19210, partial [Kocuria sp. CPCC 205274]